MNDEDVLRVEGDRLPDLYEYWVNGVTIYSMKEHEDLGYWDVYMPFIERFKDGYLVSYLDENMIAMNVPMEATGRTEEEAISNMVKLVYSKNEIVEKLNLEDDDDRIF